MKICRINYKSDFLLTLTSDAGWAVPFCIKFWTSAPRQAYFAGWDGETWTHCAYDPAEPTKLKVQFDDHRLTVGELRYEISYHFAMADFPDDTEDEVLNRSSVVAEVDGMACQVVLDFQGETAPDIQFALPAYANEAQRIANEEARIEAEQQRVSEFSGLKAESEAATAAANSAATLANEKAQLAADKAALAQAAAVLANEKAQLAADKAALAQAAAALANEKAQLAADKAALAQAAAALANEKAALAQQKADYANAQGDYAKEQGDIAQAGHERAEADHDTAADDHTTAASDHTQAAADHETLAPTVAEHTQQIAGLGTSKQDVITNLATIAMGSGVSHDDTYSATRTSTIANFILLTNAMVNILFTTPINAADATLNVSNTGAKPVRILGQSLPAGVVKAQTYATLFYDGTAWNIVNLFCPGAEYDPAGLLVDMGLPSGVKWAARDIDLTKPGGFCETPFIYEKSFFSWGNIDGHNPISNSAFSYDWGGVNEAEPWYEGQPYDNTPGNTLTGNIAVGEDFDAARANLGDPWRMPTNANFNELFANIIYIDANGDEVDTAKTDKRVTVNGVLGVYIQSKLNSARLFFSCSGYGYGRSWSNRGSNGYYWSSTFYSARYARYLRFNSGGVNPQNNYNRYNGFAVRPVQ